jgi:putative ABC transport system permease protein
MDDTARQIAILGGVMLFIITTLLVGPAFAVSAARQRRTLALAASNGAETRQLRRSVLAQALVLGAAAAVAGTALGVGGTWAAIELWGQRHPEWSTAQRPLDIPWQALGLILPCAVVSALVAALLPALRLGRLDIIGVMRGQSVSPRLNRFAPAAGLVLAVGGALYLVATVRNGGREYQVAFGAIALVLGTLLIVPALLVLAGRVAASLPVAARMATRDAARHRNRSTPTVAAILAGVAALTTFSIALASDTEQREREYVSQTLTGEAVVGTWDVESRRVVDRILPTAAQGLLTVPLHVVQDPEDWQWQASRSGVIPGSTEDQPPTRFVAALPDGCDIADVTGPAPTPRCNVLGSQAWNRGQIAVLPAAEVARRLGLTDAQRKVVADGGIAVATTAVRDAGRVTIVTGAVQTDPDTGERKSLEETGRATLEVVAVPSSTMTNGAMPQEAGALVALETAQRLGWPLTQAAVLLRDPDGSIDRATETRLDERLGAEYGSYVERGFTRDDEVPMRILFGVTATLLLVVTLIATALSMAEQQADMATFAAVGATRRTRRALAGSQAMVVGLIGAVLGVAVGLVPGIAVTYPLTAQNWDPVTGQEVATGPTLVIPWAPLVLVVVGVPLVAGLLAATAIRRAPAVARRVE